MLEYPGELSLPMPTRFISVVLKVGALAVYDDDGDRSRSLAYEYAGPASLLLFPRTKNTKATHAHTTINPPAKEPIKIGTRDDGEETWAAAEEEEEDVVVVVVVNAPIGDDSVPSAAAIVVVVVVGQAGKVHASSSFKIHSYSQSTHVIH